MDTATIHLSKLPDDPTGNGTVKLLTEHNTDGEIQHFITHGDLTAEDVMPGTYLVTSLKHGNIFRVNVDDDANIVLRDISTGEITHEYTLETLHQKVRDAEYLPLKPVN